MRGGIRYAGTWLQAMKALPNTNPQMPISGLYATTAGERNILVISGCTDFMQLSARCMQRCSPVSEGLE